MQLITYTSTISDGLIDPRPEFQSAYQTSLKQILANRHRLLAKIGVQNNLVRMAPVHSANILIINKHNQDQWEGQIVDNRPQVDAIITDQTNLAIECDPGDCAVYTCYHPDYKLLAMIHAGLTGSIFRLPEKVIAQMSQMADADQVAFCKRLRIQMSPAICGLHYRKSEMVIPTVEKSLWKPYLTGEYRPRLMGKQTMLINTDGQGIGVDFTGFTRQRLLDIGISDGNIDLSAICTYENPNYPSHYRHRKQKDQPDNRFMVVSLISK